MDIGSIAPPVISPPPQPAQQTLADVEAAEEQEIEALTTLAGGNQVDLATIMGVGGILNIVA
jgi:hypothetical protein